MKTLLAVGLSPEDLGLLRGVLADRGWVIRTAEGWTQVFLRLRERSYHAVLTEATLTDGDWRDVLDELRLCTVQPPLVVTSRLADAYLWASVLDAGGADVLATPFETAETLRVLDRAGRNTKPEGRRLEPILAAASGV